MKSNRNSLEWLTRFREWIYQNHRSTALAAENALLAENGPTPATDSVAYGALPPSDRQDFRLGKEIEPGVVSPEFQARVDTLRGK